MDRVQDGGARARREDAVAGRVGAERSRPRVLCEMWFRRRRRTHILVRHRSADRPGDGHARCRRVYEETQNHRPQHRRHRRDLVPGGGPLRGAAASTQQRADAPGRRRRSRPSLRIDSERLMAAVTTLADPKWEGRAAGSPGGLAARAWIVDRFKTHRPAAGVRRVRASLHLHAHDDERTAGGRGRERARHVRRHRSEAAVSSSCRRITITSAFATARCIRAPTTTRRASR